MLNFRKKHPQKESPPYRAFQRKKPRSILLLERERWVWALAKHSDRSDDLHWHCLQCETEPIEAGNGEEESWWVDVENAMERLSPRISPRSSKKVRCAAPGIAQVTRILTVPVVEGSRIDETVAYEVSQAFPMNPTELLWCYHPLRKSDHEMKVLVVAARRTLVDHLFQITARHGIRVEVLLPEISVLREVMATSDALPAAHGMAVFPAGPGVDLLCHYRNGDLESHSMYWESPEENPRAARRVSALLDRFKSTSVGEVEADPASSIPSLVFGNPEDASECLMMTVAELPSPQWINLIEKIDLAAAPDLGSATTITHLFGVLGSPSTERSVPVDLSPETEIAERVIRKRKPWWLSAVLLFAITALAPWWHYSILEERAEERRQQAETQRAHWLTIRLQLEENLRVLPLMEEEITVLTEALASRTGWLGFLADLQERLAEIEDVWLDGVSLIGMENSSPSMGRRSPNVSASTEDTDLTTPLRQLHLRGRMVDRENPLTRASLNTQRRVHRLLDHLEDSPYLHRITDRRFDTRHHGLLGFEFTAELIRELLP